MAFITIHTPPDLDAAGRKLAYRLGPRMVNSRADYALLLERAGFSRIQATDITKEFLRISQRWYRARGRHEDELRAALGDARVREIERDSRLNIAGIERGVLRRSVFIAVT
jgi:hypothetical protein